MIPREPAPTFLDWKRGAPHTLPVRRPAANILLPTASARPRSGDQCPPAWPGSTPDTVMPVGVPSRFANRAAPSGNVHEIGQFLRDRGAQSIRLEPRHFSSAAHRGVAVVRPQLNPSQSQTARLLAALHPVNERPARISRRRRRVHSENRSRRPPPPVRQNRSPHSVLVRARSRRVSAKAGGR